MSALRKLLTHPASYLALVAVFACLLLFDVCREPNRQLSARAYLTVVRIYQAYASPLLKGRVQCRYIPTCSQYSVEAVCKFGIVEGLVLTARRLARCRKSVPLGTEDRPIEGSRDLKKRSVREKSLAESVSPCTGRGAAIHQQEPLRRRTENGRLHRRVSRQVGWSAVPEVVCADPGPLRTP